MPIRPSERGRYPADWPAISQRIRTERAGGRCECDGRCRSWHCQAYIDRLHNADPPDSASHVDRCGAVNGQPHPFTGSRVVLTVAHLDHEPENCDDDNLAAMCQACHLSYDRDHHAETRSATRRAMIAASGQLDLGIDP